jgi:hypothetical protein
MNRLIHTAILAAAALALPPAIADEGAFEISPLCVDTGCFEGDSPGFPVTISNAGHYVLTGSLDVSDEADAENVSGIVVLGLIDVSIDLNGFEIRGPVSCTGTPVSACSSTSGTGDGILAGVNSRVTIRNGAIKGMGDKGVQCAFNARGCTVEDLRLDQNGSEGILSQVDTATFLTEVTATRNGGEGISIIDGSIRDSVAYGNGANGVSVSQATIDGVTTNENALDGIAGSGRIVDSSASGNGQDGIRCFGCIASGNTASSNGRYGMSVRNRSLWGANRMGFNDAADADEDSGNLVTAPNLCLDTSC